MIPVEYDLDLCRQYRYEREQAARNHRLIQLISTRPGAHVTLFEYCALLARRIGPYLAGLLGRPANLAGEQIGPPPVAATVLPMQSD